MVCTFGGIWRTLKIAALALTQRRYPTLACGAFRTARRRGRRRYCRRRRRRSRRLRRSGLLRPEIHRKKVSIFQRFFKHSLISSNASLPTLIIQITVNDFGSPLVLFLYLLPDLVYFLAHGAARLRLPRLNVVVVAETVSAPPGALGFLLSGRVQAPHVVLPLATAAAEQARGRPRIT